MKYDNLYAYFPHEDHQYGKVEILMVAGWLSSGTGDRTKFRFPALKLRKAIIEIIWTQLDRRQFRKTYVRGG